MSLGTVTIVVPTYKRPVKLRRAILSILDQSYRDLRVLVFDNASSDGTEQVVRDLIATDSRVQYYCHSENIGITRNFRFAYGKIETPYFGLLTDDDYFLPNFIEDAMQAFQRHPQIQFAFLSAPTVQEDGTFISDQLEKWPKEGVYAPGESISTAVSGHHPILTMCIFKLSLLSEFQFHENMGPLADIPILISVLAKYPFHLSKKVGGYFIRHSEAAGNDFGRMDDTRAICAAFLSMEEGFKRNLTIEPKIYAKIVGMLRNRVNRTLFEVMFKSLRVNNKESYLYAEHKLFERIPSIWQISGALLFVLNRSISPSRVAGYLNVVRTAAHKVRNLSRIP